MRIESGYFIRSKQAASRLRRAVFVSLLFHAILIGGLTAVAQLWPPDKISGPIEVLYVGKREGKEGVESTRLASLPPGDIAPKAAPPKPKVEAPKPPEPPKPQETRKPEPPKPEPKKMPEPKKEPEKKEVKKEPEKKEPEKKEAKKEPEKKAPAKDVKKTLPSLEPLADVKLDDLTKDVELDDLSDADIQVASRDAQGAPGGGLANARVSNRAQDGYGDPRETESGISVRGMPSILSTWAKQVQRNVLRYWNAPGGVSVGNRTIISFTVSRDGQLLGEPQVAEPSGDAALDASGIQAVKVAAPYPPLPVGFSGSQQEVLFVFTVAG